MAGYRIEKVQFPFPFLFQQFAFKPTINNNIKPIAGLRPATLVVVGLINKCCKLSNKASGKKTGNADHADCPHWRSQPR